jgi:hypothetical protein
MMKLPGTRAQFEGSSSETKPLQILTHHLIFEFLTQPSATGNNDGVANATIDKVNPSCQSQSFITDFIKSLGQQMVTFSVGPKSQLFTAHENLLCRLALESYASKRENRYVEMEGQGRVVRFEEVSPAVFELYIEWLYRDRINIQYKDPEEHIRNLHNLYSLTNTLCCESMLQKYMKGGVFRTINDVAKKHNIIKSMWLYPLVKRIIKMTFGNVESTRSVRFSIVYSSFSSFMSHFRGKRVKIATIEAEDVGIRY